MVDSYERGNPVQAVLRGRLRDYIQANAKQVLSRPTPNMCFGAVVLWCFGALVFWCFGALVLWFSACGLTGTHWTDRQALAARGVWVRGAALLQGGAQGGWLLRGPPGHNIPL